MIFYFKLEIANAKSLRKSNLEMPKIVDHQEILPSCDDNLGLVEKKFACTILVPCLLSQ